MDSPLLSQRYITHLLVTVYRNPSAAKPNSSSQIQLKGIAKLRSLRLIYGGDTIILQFEINLDILIDTITLESELILHKLIGAIALESELTLIFVDRHIYLRIGINTCVY